MRGSKFIILIFLVYDACITPYEIHTPFHEQVVIQGMITDEPGPYHVKITKTIPVESPLNYPPPVTGASVKIQDDEENSEYLVESSPGNYFTKTFQGMVGRSYWITITTTEGAVYQSAPEKLEPVGNITDLRYEFEQNEPADVNNQRSSRNGFKIYLDCEVLPEQQNRVWWRWTGTFEIRTFPMLQTTPVLNISGPAIYIPSPAPCSGYRVGSGNTLTGPFKDCTCCICWVTQYNLSPLISDMRFVNDGMIRNFYVTFIEANRRTFYQKYYLQVDQLSVSETVYEFWRAIKTDQNQTNLFQAPSARTTGNIASITANAPSAIGYFAASAIKHRDLVIDRSAVPYRLLEIDTVVSKCTDAYQFSSTKKPIFW